tara:strand:- start:5902 stop:6069 length:168 start_codon:yes stop_codon:yes gene_type:complete
MNEQIWNTIVESNNIVNYAVLTSFALAGLVVIKDFYSQSRNSENNNIKQSKLEEM